MFRKNKKSDKPALHRIELPALTGDYAEAVRPLLADPYMVAALTVETLDAFAADRDRCFRQLALLRSPQRLLPRDLEGVRQALEHKSYLPRSYYEGATPENGYTPETPRTVICEESPLAPLDVDILRVNVLCGGDPLPRTVTLRRRADGYALWDYANLLIDPLPPSEKALSGEEPDESASEYITYEEMNGLKQFPIGCWTYFPLKRAYPGMVKDWHDLGLNNPLTPSFAEGDDKNEMLRILDECASYGMEVFLWDERALWRTLTQHGEAVYRRKVSEAIADFGGHPAVKGFYIGDEPDAPDAADAFAAARICRELAPNLVHFLNLLPWFDWIGPRIGSDAYAPYLDRAVEEGRVQLLAYDCYTQMWEGDKGFDVYFNNLREHSEAARRNHVDFCPTLLSMGHYDYRCPSYDDFRWQLSTAAAFGAKSAYWFYIHQTDFHANYRRPVLNFWNERTTEYEWLSAVNRQFQLMFGSELMRLHIEDIGFTVKAYGGCELFKPCDKILGVDNGKNLNLLFNRFSDDQGGKYAVIVNADTKENCTANIHLAKDVKLYRRTSAGGYEPVAAIEDAVGKQAYGSDASTASLILAPGQMELLRIGG